MSNSYFLKKLTRLSFVTCSIAGTIQYPVSFHQANLFEQNPIPEVSLISDHGAQYKIFRCHINCKNSNKCGHKKLSRIMSQITKLSRSIRSRTRGTFIVFNFVFS